MPLSLGLDLGTTTITALALEVASGEIVGRNTAANDAEIASQEHKARGWSEWDAAGIASIALRALRALSDSLGTRTRDVAGLGLTGQQHGIVLLDDRFTPLGPFINWQDRRVEEINPSTGTTWLGEIRSRAGSQSRQRTGCTLSPGYLSGTRENPESRGSLTGISTENFTPAHLTRALLEGMAAIFRRGQLEIEAVLGARRRYLVGAGNGLRENAVLADIVATEFGIPMRVPRHREEAAFGAALFAAVGLGLLPGRNAAARLIRHEPTIGGVAET
jgi:sugar (pentulose or hexulose) kinase